MMITKVAFAVPKGVADSVTPDHILKVIEGYFDQHQVFNNNDNKNDK